MIYVTVGTQKFPFNRLLREVDRYIEEGLINEPVFAQIGSSTYLPRNYPYERYLSKDRFAEYVKKCDVLVTHSGIATIMLGLGYKKPVIVIPRLARYGEHVDDHQSQIAQIFSEKNYVMQCGQNDNLAVMISCAKEHHFSEYVSQNQRVVAVVKDYLSNVKESEAQPMRSKMKIGMLALDLDRTGISTVIMNCCRYINRTNFEIELLVGDRVVPEYADECERLGIQIIRLPLKHEYTRQYYVKLFKILWDKKYDIFHVHGNSAMVTPDLFLAHLAGIRLNLVHAHNTTCDYPVIHRLLSPFFRLMYKKGLACSIQAGQWMFGKNRFEVLHNGIETGIYRYNQEKRKEFRKKIHMKEEFLIGHAGQFDAQKNQRFLLKVFAQTSEKQENIRLLLAGNGPDFEEIMDEIDKHPYKERIIVLGDSSQMDYVYNAVDLFVLPSLFEGLPLVLVEAQAAGLTCLVSDRVSHEADLSGNIEFLPVDSTDVWENAIKREICKKEDRQKKSENAQKRILENEYDAKNSVLKLQKIYQDLSEEFGNVRREI